MKILFLSAALFLFSFCHAQYYYNDIIATQDMNRLMNDYREQKVKTVTAAGYDERGAKTSDFAEVQEVKENGTLLKVSTMARLMRTTVYNRFDAQGKLVETTDSTNGIISITTYSYDAHGKISSIRNTTKDPKNEFSTTEVHQWSYAAAGRPQGMIRTIDGRDSLEIRFTGDEKDNPGEEITFNRGRETDHVYYYFDEQGRITDIVRYNAKAKKLLPDNMFNYDDAGRVIQKISSTPPSKFGKITWVGYQIWRYNFNEKGLKTVEGLFDNNQQLTGRIRYTYAFGR